MKREPQISESHGGPNRTMGLNATLRIYVSLHWVEYRLWWTIWFLLLMFFNTEHLKAFNQKLHNDHSLERIHQKNALTAAGFMFTVTSAWQRLPVSSILFPMTITKAMHNLTHHVFCFTIIWLLFVKPRIKQYSFWGWICAKLWKQLGREMH